LGDSGLLFFICIAGCFFSSPRDADNLSARATLLLHFVLELVKHKPNITQQYIRLEKEK